MKASILLLAFGAAFASPGAAYAASDYNPAPRQGTVAHGAGGAASATGRLHQTNDHKHRVFTRNVEECHRHICVGL